MLKIILVYFVLMIADTVCVNDYQHALYFNKYRILTIDHFHISAQIVMT